jgi:CBS domain-containing protein
MKQALTVDDIMIKSVKSIEIPGSRDEVLDLMQKERISAVPVVKEGTLLGIVTRIDLLKHPTEEQIALLMTRDPVTITPDAPISEAARILLMTGLRRLPVVVKNKLVGIVTVADIVGAIGQMDITVPIKTYVKNGIVAVWEETPVSVVSEIIRLSKHDALPVLNNKNELTGIITITDLINMSRIEDSVEKSDMSSGADEDKWTWESMRDTMSLYYGVSRIKLPDIPVKNVMVKEVITAFHKTPVSDCAKKMRRNRIEQVPVITADNKLDGLLLDRDLLAVLVQHEA